jgi:hypothetical protein
MYFFLVVLGFELWAPYLVGGHSTPDLHVLFCVCVIVHTHTHTQNPYIKRIYMVQRLVSYVSTWQELGYIRFFLYNRLLNFNGHIDHLGITLKYRH